MGEFPLESFLQIFSWVANKISGKQESKRAAATSTAPYRKCTLNFSSSSVSFFERSSSSVSLRILSELRSLFFHRASMLQFSRENIRLFSFLE
jgi:hypothetical protein